MRFHDTHGYDGNRRVIVSALLIALLTCPLTLTARRVAPLLEDDWARRPHRAAECTFGKQIRELGSTWYADLGPPFGVMYCIKCECIPVQKKRRIVARVQCRNIKNECPKVTCEEPVLLPGKCCKSCPGDNLDTDVVQDVPAQLTAEEEERNLRHFGTLLTGRTTRYHDPNPSSLPLTTTTATATSTITAINLDRKTYNYAATGRFTFHRKNLYYSFYLSSVTPRPRNIQFIDSSGNILEEQAIDPIGGTYQNATGKLCGVWRRVPRDYRKLLREDRLRVSLIWEPFSSLTGQLSKFRALSTEQFSSLLEASSEATATSMLGSAGTAIVSASLASAPSVHVSLVFNGLFSPNDINDVPIIVQLEHLEKEYVVFKEEILISKPSQELNFGEVRSAISGADLRLLTRGKLSLTLTSKTDPKNLRLSGVVAPKVTCEIYQSPMVVEKDEDTRNASSPIEAFGLAWMFIDRFNALRYGVQLIGLEGDNNPLITLVDDGGKRQTELEDLTPNFHDGLANGTLERLGPRLLEPLFSNELSIIATSHFGFLVRGRLMQRLVADARDTSAPVLLRRSGQPWRKLPKEPTAVGMVWAAIDVDCTLHYELEVSGMTPKEDTRKNSSATQPTLKLYLETMPLLVQGAPVARRLLEEFTGNILEGSVTGLSPVELYRIESGIGFLEVSDNRSSRVLRAPFKARAPLSCLPHYADNDVASVVAYNLQPPKPNVETGACFHETRFYEEGTQWTSNSDPCAMCHCYRGLAQCDPIPCPVLSCPSGKETKPPSGQCCPICSPHQSNGNSTTALTPIDIWTDNSANTTPSSTRGCTLAGQFHSAGASWHPYLPPSGFDTCAVCTCDPETLQVKCPRVQCPQLECDEKLAFRPDKKACCRQCPVISVVSQNNTLVGGEMLPRDQASAITMKKSPEEILASGGCKYPVGGPYENGREWHPRIHSHGEMKCVKCRCKNGEVKCDRKRCSRSLCNAIAHQIKRGEYITDIDDCCTLQCRRSRRHHRNSHHHHNHHHHAQKHSVTPRDSS